MNYQRTGLLLNRQYMEYLFPTIMSSVSILLASFVDGILASAFSGNDAFNAVNLSEPAILFMQAVFFLFGIGGAVRISVAKGRREHERANALFSLAFFLCIGASVLVGIAGLVFLDEIAAAMCSDPVLLPLVKDYTRINLMGAPLMIFVPMMTFIIRTDGMPKLSANILLFANILNLIMDIVYMKFLNMGVAGAALATLTGYALGLGMVIIYLAGKKRTLKLRFPRGKDWAETGSLLSGGIASVLNTVLLFVKALLLNKLVLETGGKDAMLIFSVCNFMVSFASMFIGGGSDTMTPLLGLLYGEKDQKGMDYVFKRTMMIVMVASLITIAIVVLFPELVLALFSIKSEDVVAIGIPALRIFAVSLLGIAVSYTLMNYYQTISRKAISVMITVLRGIAITVPAAWIFAKSFGVSGIWTAFPIAEFLTVIITLAVAFLTAVLSKGKYKGILLKECIPEGDAVFDMTLKADQAAAVDISKMLEDFCRKNGQNNRTSAFAGVLAEEMIENIRLSNEPDLTPDVDVVCRLSGEELLLLVRDNGKTLSSAEPEEGSDQFTNLKMIHSLAEEVDYSRTLGLNSTVVKMSKNNPVKS